MYSIGQVSEMFDIPISTLRYYDKEGFFPNLQRVSGIRKFSDHDLEVLHVVECLKRSGLEISDIRLFIKWCAEGSDSYEKRYGLFLQQKAAVEEEIEKMQQVLDMVRFKCWYYEQAIADGNETRLSEIIPDKLPPEIKKLYEHGHGRQVEG